MKYAGENSIRRVVQKVKELLNSKADKTHTHTKANITDFSHTHPKAEISDFGHKHVKADVTDFSHTHAKAEVGLGSVDNVKQYSSSNPPPYPVTKVNNKTGAVSLNHIDVGAVQNSGVNGEDGGHKMAMSWNGTKVIVGIDNNAAVKTMVDTSMIDVTNSGWIRITMSNNFLTSGAPWINQMRRSGSVVTLEADLTLKFQLAAGTKYLVFYTIPAQFKPKTLWKNLFYSEQNKRYFLEFFEDGTNGLHIRIQPLETMEVGDRMRVTFTYMV